MQRSFREALLSEGVGWTTEQIKDHRGQPQFSFYTNSGDFFTDQDPAKVRRVLELDRKCGDYMPNSSYLLGLYVSRDAIERKELTVKWDRYALEGTIAPSEWLDSHGQSFGPW